MTPLRELSLEQARDLTRTCSVPELIDALSATSVEGNPLPTYEVCIGRGILADSAEVFSRWLPADGNWAVVMDEHTKAAAGDAVVAQLPNATPVVLDPLPGWEHVTPHDTMVDRLADLVEGCSALVAVGSGTINDLCKTVAFRQDKLYAAVATAPSMNGYTSALSAIVFDGLKSTTPCPPPIAVLADVDVLVTAPVTMARSGYADMMAKPVSSADWKLASLVVGGEYNDLPALIVGRALDACIDCAEAIGNNEPAAIETLMQCLILSGFSMTLAGSSAPASGGEHLMSHYWDMSAYANDVPPPALHGLQVALGVLMSARLYELLWQQDPDSFVPTTMAMDEMADVHGILWNAIRSEAEAQHLTEEQVVARIAKVRDLWPTIKAELAPLLQSPEEIKIALKRAGVPLTPAAHGIKPEMVRLPLLHAADIRNRYSILHFARELGLLSKLADEILSVFEIT